MEHVCESCGDYAPYKDFCGHWMCNPCAEAEDDAVEAACQRQLDGGYFSNN